MLIKDGVNVTGSAWISGFVAPDDGDERLAAHIQVMGGMLAERTLYLKNTSINWSTGGTYNNATIQLNGAVLLYGVTIAANLELTGGSSLKVSPARAWERHSLRLLTSTYLGADSANPSLDPDAWPTLVAGAPAIQTRSSTDSSDEHWIALDDLPNGGTLATVEVTTKGADAGTSLMTFPRFRVARFKGTGALQFLCAEVTDAHVLANWDTALPTSITITDNATIDKSFTYVLVVRHAYYSPAAGKAYVLDVKAVGTVEVLGL
jgi:hypothetical protein